MTFKGRGPRMPGFRSSCPSTVTGKIDHFFLDPFGSRSIFLSVETVTTCRNMLDTSIFAFYPYVYVPVYPVLCLALVWSCGVVASCVCPTFFATIPASIGIAGVPVPTTQTLHIPIDWVSVSVKLPTGKSTRRYRGLLYQ